MARGSLRDHLIGYVTKALMLNNSCKYIMLHKRSLALTIFWFPCFGANIHVSLLYEVQKETRDVWYSGY